jgi:hypothetical protein
MAITYGAAVSAAAPAVADTNVSQDTGAVNQGIGRTGADGASIGGQRIGAATTTTDIKFETNVAP